MCERVCPRQVRLTADRPTPGRFRAVLYSRVMVWVRLRTTARTVAWVLLAWVAVDLGVPNLCALEREQGFAISGSSTAVAPDDGGGIPIAPPHVDDCFCCSHCVDVTQVSGATAPPLADTRVVLPPAAIPFPFGLSLYHPPRA